MYNTPENMYNPGHFWLNLNYLIKVKHSSLRGMCEDLGVGYSAMKSLKARDSCPDLPTALRIADWLGLTDLRVLFREPPILS